jgi:hypothetical protein
MRTDRGKQSGQAGVEFTVVAVALVAALCLPWADGLSPAEWLLGAVVEAAAALPAWLAVL